MPVITSSTHILHILCKELQTYHKSSVPLFDLFGGKVGVVHEEVHIFLGKFRRLVAHCAAVPLTAYT